MPTTQTPLLVAFNLFLLVMMFLLMRKATSYPFKVNSFNKRLAIFFSFIFVLFSFWGTDWFHYSEVYQKLLNGDQGHMEDVYVTIVQNFSVGYISFRFVIWGVGLMLLYLYFNRIFGTADLAMFFFFSIWLIWFSYARVSLAMILVYLGGSLLYKPTTPKVLSYTLGILLLFSSLLFHKTAIFAVFITILSIISGLFDRRFFAVIVPIVLIVSPFLISSFLFDFMSMESEDSMMDLSVKYGQYYLDGESSTLGFGALLQRIFEIVPYYLLAMVSYVVLLRRNIDKDIAINMRILILIVVVASTLSFANSYNTTVLFVRFMRFAYIPASIILTYLWINNIYRIKSKIIYYIAILGTFYTVLYSLYCSIVG